MKVCFVTFRSITFAQRGQEVLRRGGVSASLSRTPRWMEEKGCGYRLSVPEDKLHKATALLQGSSIAYSKVYCPESEGKGEEKP